MRKLGIALGGGGLKGLAHIGVLEILDQNQIPVSMVSGTSFGSIIAALLAAEDYLDLNVSGLLKYIMGLINPNLNMSLDGIIKGKRLKKLIDRATGGKELQDVQIPLAIIACDIDAGQKIVFSNRDLQLTDKNTVVIKDALLSDAVMASLSIPGTFIPYKFKGRQLVDGGLQSIVPVLVQKQLKAEYILAVNLGAEIYTQKVKGIPQIISRTLDILIYKNSNIIEDFFANMTIYPGIKDIHIDDIDRAGEIIRAGRRAMNEKITALKTELRIV